MPKATIAKKVIAEDNGSVEIQFTDENVDNVVANLNEMSDEIKVNLMLHGLSQKLGDAYAGVKDVREAAEKVGNVLGRLLEGNWKAARAAGSARITDLVQALSDVTGKAIEEAFDVVSNMETSAKKKLRAHPQIKLRLAEISAERAKKAAESSDESIDDLLG